MSQATIFITVEFLQLMLHLQRFRRLLTSLAIDHAVILTSRTRTQ